ncbi:YggS family pyridoxal phosphate-dependent enzyme [Leucobacter sp. wl10]|uniref:YggS family pyridoxal phosphate-dependent enzyme n=1 Tax=Leucobacter sp. wl10 TaxID=2304677 RepID=UPI000E5BE3F5|nr:YggS family pyridoxal phosphate-dependent enzyme [Leucobacter sp. wl10]RGE21001.1 YggS family pyridoxal phosphate-dependent enzyme [Leucobacter sp. wl10]
MTNQTEGELPVHDFPTANSIDAFVRNIARVRSNIARAAERAGRSADEIRLLPVSKTVPEERIRLAVRAGCRELGENKVQEAKRKSENLADLRVAWSVIGHLQTNKARDVASFASEFQALDSLRAAAALDRRLQAAGRSLDVSVQVNTSAEPQKYGLAPDELEGFLRQMPHYSSLRVRGLMTLAIFTSDVPRVRTCFALLRTLRDRLRDTDPTLVGDGGLSMGMSGDYEVAVEEGATCVRVGQAIFGAREVPDSHYWPDAFEAGSPAGADADAPRRAAQ